MSTSQPPGQIDNLPLDLFDEKDASPPPARTRWRRAGQLSRHPPMPRRTRAGHRPGVVTGVDDGEWVAAPICVGSTIW